jgi:ribA/ribD-fused uncharacterized protein
MAISFTKTTLKHGWLGNMAAFPLEYEGKTWKTAEALFQAMRFTDDAIREEIRAQKSPMQAKMTAKKYADKMVVEPKSKEDLVNMDKVLRLKLEQHPHLKQALLETGEELIVEDITNRPPGGNHAFWGAALVEGEWVGENNLGLLWMWLREELRKVAP